LRAHGAAVDCHATRVNYAVELLAGLVPNGRDVNALLAVVPASARVTSMLQATTRTRETDACKLTR
jgi:hypothetical protein